MDKKTAVVISIIFTSVIISAPVIAQTTQENGSDNSNLSISNDSNQSSQPLGLYIASTVASQNAAVQDKINETKFDIEFREGNKTQSINNRTRELQKRLEHLRQTKQELKNEYRNGSLDESVYHVRLAEVESREEGLNESINNTEDKLRGLDRAAMNGVNTTAIEILKNNARNLSGKRVSEIARSIGGPPRDIERGPPGERGPPSFEERGSEEDEEDERGPTREIERGRNNSSNEDRVSEDRRGPPRERPGR